MWDRGNGGFPEQSGIGDGVCIHRWIYEETMMLATYCFLGFFVCEENSALFVWNTHVLIFPACATKAFSCPNWSPLKWEHFGRGFQAIENSCTKQGLQGNEAPLCFLCPNYRRSVAVKKVRVASLREATMRLVCVQGFDETFEHGSSQILVCVFSEMMLLSFCKN